MASQTGFEKTAVLTIKDLETGRVWVTELTKNDIQVQRTPRFFSADGSREETVEVSINIGKYLSETLPSPRASAEQLWTDGMTISTGMTYNFDGQNVRISSVFGSSVTEGFYYATNKTQYYRHPGTNAGGKWQPVNERWNYSVDSGYGLYMTDAPPKAILDCTVRITGMTAYREVSVTCSL